jgi:hypothetical protein
MPLRRFQALQLVVLISAMVATRAAAQNSTTTKQVRINLTEPDGLVTRFMIVNGGVRRAGTNFAWIDVVQFRLFAPR